jgi:hypothetical protein
MWDEVFWNLNLIAKNFFPFIGILLVAVVTAYFDSLR